MSTKDRPAVRLADLSDEAALPPDQLERDYNARATVSPETFDAEIRAYRTTSDAMRAPWGRHFDVLYDAASGQTLDVFGPQPDGSLRPVFVFIHGGYWRALSKQDSAMMAGMLAEAGIATAAIDYRLAPGASLGEIVREVRAAIAFIFQRGSEFSLDPNRIHVGGSSAGGHLAATTIASGWHDSFGVPRNVIKSALLLSGLFDLAPVAATFPQTWLNLSSADVAALSPARHVPEHDGCPIIVAWAELEALGFKRQSETFQAAWTEAGHHSQRIEVPGRNHYDVLTELTDPDTPLAKALIDCIRTVIR